MVREVLKKIISLVKKAEAANWLLIIIPSIIFILHAFLFRSWINDDAGIAFSYARSLSQGYGLVSQPGNIPVEGYSNFLWVLLLAPFFSLGIFHPVIIPKLLSILIVIISFIVLRKSLLLLSNNSKWIAFIVLTLIAINTSFVIWSTSGLENPLYVLLLCLLLSRSVQTIGFEKTDNSDAISLGVLAGAIALTRPEGVLYFSVYPLLLLLSIKWSDKRNIFHKPGMVNLLIYTLSFILFYGSYILFRLVYFNDLFPNTYHVKGGRLFSNLTSIITLRPKMLIKIQDIMFSVAGRFGSVVLIGLIIITIYLISTKRLKREGLVLPVLLSLTFSAYLLLPYDPIGEYRYNTAFFVFLYSYIVILTNLFIKGLNLKRSSKMILVISMVFVSIAGSIFLFSKRSVKFSQHPPVPFEFVSRRFGERFNQYADRLGIREGSLLLPDLGGTLYYSRLRVYDLSGLCDKTIARTLRKNRNQNAFYDYIFERVKPTFIHAHSVWTYISALDKDERFRRDYIPIYEYPDAWIKSNCGITMHSGDYVRKDAVGNKEEALRQIRTEFKNDFQIKNEL